MKKFVLVLLLSSLLPSFIYAKDEYPKLPTLSDKQRGQSTHLQSFCSKKGKYGYQLYNDITNKTGGTIVKPVFDYTETFYRIIEVGRVQYHGKWGLVNGRMQYVLEPKYDSVEKAGNRIFYTYRLGNLVGGYIVSRRVIIPCEYTSITPIQKAKTEYEYICQKENLYGVLDDEAQVIIPFEYDEIKVLMNLDGKITYQTKSKGRCTISNGISIVKCDSVALINNWLMVTDKGKVGAYTTELQQLVPMNYDTIAIRKDYFSVKKDGKYGAYSLTGTKIVDAIFDHELKLENGQYEEYYEEKTFTPYVVTKNGKYSIYKLPSDIKLSMPGEVQITSLDTLINLVTCSGDSRPRLESAVKCILSPRASSSERADAIFEFADLTKDIEKICLRGDGQKYYDRAHDSVFLSPYGSWSEPVSGLYSLWIPDKSEDKYYETTDNQGNTYTHRVISKTGELAKNESIMNYENSQKNDTYMAFMNGTRIVSEIASEKLMERIKNSVSKKYNYEVGMCGIHPLSNNLYVIEGSFKEYIGKQTIVYDDPTYISFGFNNQLMMVNSGRITEKFYEYDHYLFVIDKNFNIIRTISRPKDHVLTFFSDNSFCFIPQEESEDINDVIFYDNKGNYKFTYEAPDGHVYSNIVKYGDAMYMGGYTRTHGYIDFANPMVVKFDANTGEHIDTKYLKQKAWVEQLAIKGNVLYAQFSNGSTDFYGDTRKEPFVPYLKLNSNNQTAQSSFYKDGTFLMTDFKWGGERVTRISVNPYSALYKRLKDYFIIVPTHMKYGLNFIYTNDASGRVFVKYKDKYAVTTIGKGFETNFIFSSEQEASNHLVPSASQRRRQELKGKSNVTLKQLLRHPLGIPSVNWTDGRVNIMQVFKENLEADYKYSDNLATRGDVTDYESYFIVGSLKKSLILYYKISTVSFSWHQIDKSRGRTPKIEISYHLVFFTHGTSNGEKELVEYLRSDFEQLGCSFTQPYHGRKSSTLVASDGKINDRTFKVSITPSPNSVALDITFNL